MTDLTERKLKACQVKPINTVPYSEELQALKEENARLKGLLKECKELIKRSFDDYPNSAIYRAINSAIGESEE